MSVGILPNVNSVKSEQGCRAWDKCLFPHHKVDEQPNRKPKKSYHSHKGRESEDKSAAAVVKTVPECGCVSQDSESLESERGAESRGNPMQKVVGSIRRVRFTQSTLRQASIREVREHGLEKYKSKFLISDVFYALKFEDGSQEETERQQRCARGKAWNLAKNKYKLKEKDKAAFYSPSERMGTADRIHHKTEGKRVCGRFRCEYAYGQQERP